MKTHAGRTILITGASSGIGAHVAIELAARGANVVLGARRVDKLRDIVEHITREGGSAYAVPLDVCDEASVIAAYDAAEARFGLVDTLVANAGVNVEALSTDITLEQYDAIHAVNTRGVFISVREAGKRLLARDQSARGRILIVASMGGRHPLPYLVAYCGSKAGAVMLGRGFAAEWSRAGICVNVLCPGYIKTDINNEWFESESGARMIAKLPRKRLMPLSALDNFVTHLTSDSAAHTTGSVIQVDDGQRI